MLGNILIDKIKISFRLQGVSADEAKRLEVHVKSVLGEHYAENAYSVSINKCFTKLNFWFTPTRYFDDMNCYLQYTDTNLETPPECKLKELFNAILSDKTLVKALPECKITVLDLTKNFITLRKPYYYLMAIAGRQYQHGYKVLQQDCGYYSKTVTITHLMRNTCEKDSVGDDELKFYDKVRELLNKHVYKVTLKEALSSEDKKQFTLKNYNALTKTLLLDNLNILRLEWHFKSKKMYKISRILKFKNADKGLFLKDFIDLLNSGTLYNSLDEFYTVHTLKLLKSEPAQTSPLNIYSKVLSKYYPEVIALPLTGVFKENNLYKKYHKNLLKIQNAGNDILVQEIIQKLEESRITKPLQAVTV